MRVDGERSRAAVSHHCCESWRTVRDRDGPVRPCSTSIKSCACAFVASRLDTPRQGSACVLAAPAAVAAGVHDELVRRAIRPRRSLIDSGLLPVPSQIPCQGSGRLRAARDRINPILSLTCSSVAEGLGFEPRVTCATMVFETIRFGRSRIPPGEIVRDQEPRLEAKNARSRSPHSSARTPATTSVRWLSRGSAAKL